jgi:hypothetical protein
MCSCCTSNWLVSLLRAKKGFGLGLTQCIAQDAFAFRGQHPDQQALGAAILVVDLRLQGDAHIVGEHRHFPFVLAVFDQGFGDHPDRPQRHAFGGQALQDRREPRQWQDPLHLLRELRLFAFQPAEDRLGLLQPDELRATGLQRALHALDDQRHGIDPLDMLVQQFRGVRRQPCPLALLALGAAVDRAVGRCRRARARPPRHGFG